MWHPRAFCYGPWGCMLHAFTEPFRTAEWHVVPSGGTDPLFRARRCCPFTRGCGAGGGRPQPLTSSRLALGWVTGSDKPFLHPATKPSVTLGKLPQKGARGFAAPSFFCFCSHVTCTFFARERSILWSTPRPLRVTLSPSLAPPRLLCIPCPPAPTSSNSVVRDLLL